ncbi:MAG: pectin acetylesterase-family hydrolase [Polyangiales bacterium]
MQQRSIRTWLGVLSVCIVGSGVCVREASAEPAACSARCTVDGSDPTLPVCEQWQKVEPAGTTCSDGSQYKFFVSYAEHSDNLVVVFEGGGACWDYESCSGGARGASNAQGIPDDHIVNYQFLNLLVRNEQNPARDWNIAFVPYCTGDIFVGDKVATYEDPAGGPALTYRHVGLSNTQQVIAALRKQFWRTPKLLVTGFSAGGIGAEQNYAFLRKALRPQRGYLLNDSGPVLHAGGPSESLQTIVTAAWNTDSYNAAVATVLRVDQAELVSDPGRLNSALAERYPHDRLALTTFQKDLNFSLYLYERFYPQATPTDIHAMFWGELQTLLHTFEGYENLAYYVPYFRHDNCSHCVAIPPLGQTPEIIATNPWLGSEIEERGVDARDFVAALIDDDAPLESYLEAPQPGEELTPEELAVCLTP